MTSELKLHKFGPEGVNPVFIIPTIHGDEPVGVEIAEKMIDQLKSIENIPRQILILENANPFGYENKTRENKNEVDLNRNFPTKNWEEHSLKEIKKTDAYKKGYTSWGGSKPASEEETQFMIGVENKYHPKTIIALHQTKDIAPQCVNYDGPALKVAEKISKDIGLPVEASIGYPTPGSLGNYFGVERQRETLTIELPFPDPPKELVKKIIDSLMEICLKK